MARAPAQLSRPGAEAVPRYGGVRAFLRELPAEDKRFWLLVATTGLLSGLGATGLEFLLHHAQHFAWGESGPFLEATRDASPLRRFLVPLMGGVIVAGVSLLVGLPLRGHGTAGILEGIWVRSGRLGVPRALLRGTVSIIAVAFGAPLGREGALLQTGAASGSALARALHLSPARTRLLVACGAASGMAAAYNVPIGGALFGLEVLLGNFALELFGPIVLSCTISTATSRLLLSSSPSYVIPHYAMPGATDLLVAVAVGLAVGVASALYVRVVDTFATLLERSGATMGFFLPIFAMGAVGAMAQLWPEVLGNGYGSVNEALRGTLPLLPLLVLPFLKMIATATAAGAGVPGGIFTASLFYGGLIGGAIGTALHGMWPGAPPPGAFALLGMGAVLAGTTHASVSAVLIIFELTGDYGVILPLMLSCVISAAVSRRIEPNSLYTAVLSKRNVQIPVGVAPPWLRPLTVEDLIQGEPAVVAPHAPLEEVVAKFLELEPGKNLYVVDADGMLAGVLSVDGLKGHLPHYRLLQSAVASELAMPVTPVRRDASLAEAARAFAETTLEELPIVDERRRLVGTIRKSALLTRGSF